MSGAEFNDWVRYYNAEPFGFARQETRHSDVMMSMWALHGGKEALAENRSAARWQYNAGDGREVDPEAEAQMMIAKLGGL